MTFADDCFTKLVCFWWHAIWRWRLTPGFANLQILLFQHTIQISIYTNTGTGFVVIGVVFLTHVEMLIVREIVNDHSRSTMQLIAVIIMHDRMASELGNSL